jgi:hypothetical protein
MMWINCNRPKRFDTNNRRKLVRDGLCDYIRTLGFEDVMKKGGISTGGGAALLALSLALAPAIAATTQQKAPKKKEAPGLVAGFTPAVADPRLAAMFGSRTASAAPPNFRFTPSTAEKGSKAVKVAVRARATTTAEARRTSGDAAPLGALTPTAYNLGVAVGWRRFALSGDVAKVDGGLLPVGREAAEVGLSYSGRKFTGRVQVGAERADRSAPRIIAQDESYSLDVGGSYSIARNLDVTGGVRYRIDRDRLQPVDDQRRDSQAVYIGTAFRF